MNRLLARCLAVTLINVILHLLPYMSAAMAAESHPGLGNESMYSEAVLAYNKKQTGEAVRILDDLLKAAPNHVEGLELLALTLKTLGDDKKAIEVYARLLNLKPLKERGPYHFELAVIFNRQKKPEFAKPHFEAAARLGFNTVAAHLFLGLISFNSGDLNGAESHFSNVKSGNNNELRVVASYYLGLINFKNGYGSGGTFELLDASSLADDLPESKMAQDIKKAANKVLAPFNVSQWFGTATFLGQYDSNVAQVPSGSSSTQTSGQSTGNLSLNAGFGRMSSPLRTFQWVASYRLATNVTTSSLTKTYNFLSHTPSFYLNYKPLARWNGGLKLEGAFTFQNQAEIPGNTEGSYLYRAYSTSFDVGPFLRYEVNRRLQLALETSYKSVNNTTDPTQTGTVIGTKISARGSSDSRLFNPGGTISYENNRAQGSEAAYIAIGVGTYNSMRLNSKDTVTVSLDYLSTNYSISTVGRKDSNITARTSLIHRMNGKWSLLGDLTYIKNTSTVEDSYSYNRMMIGAGIGWTL